MFVGKSGGLQLTGFRCSCIFCSGSSAKHGGMVCKKNNATKREIQQNLRLKFFNLLLFYHNALANWSSFTTAGFFLFTFSYHQKKQIQSRRKPPTAYQGSKPQNFRALKMWAGYGDIQIYLQLKTRFDIGKNCGLRSSREERKHPQIASISCWDDPHEDMPILYDGPQKDFSGAMLVFCQRLPTCLRVRDGESQGMQVGKIEQCHPKMVV